MSYEGSARKYRPQKFEKLIGQEHICQTLINSLSSKTIASAYLFSGTRGVGKTTTARILAKALNCEENKESYGEPCDKCSSCHEISVSSHPDVLEIDGATYTGVENVRDLQERLVYLPSKGKYKCIILDEVHMLSKGAFNALLKTLEEPPPNVVFIFATTELRRVPDTVISRCQTFEFRRISTQKISEHLSDVSQEKNRELEDSVIFSISRMSEGSVRDALSLLDQVLSFSEKDKIVQKDIETVLGLPPSNVYSQILTAISERNTLNALKKLKDIYEQGHDLNVFSSG
ncbi:MAG: DNA polymerase III subunit gamma/tau, partial [bacterium]